MLAPLFRHRSVLSLTAAAASWGVATVISKRAIAETPPLTLLPIQLVVSVGVLAVLVRSQGLRAPLASRRLGLLGILNPGVSYALGLVGLAHITASLSVLLWATEPLLILGLAWWLLREKITGLMATASALALTGVMLVVFSTDSTGALFGIALTLGGVAACAVYTDFARKLMVEGSTLTLAVQQTWALGFSLLLLAAVALAGRAAPLSDVSAAACISAIASGLLYYALAFWLYLTGLREVPASVAGISLNLIPLFGIAAGHLFLAERLCGRQWIGAVLIVTAVATIVVEQSRRSLAKSTI